MPFTVFWYDDEHTIIASRAEGHWTWTEYHEAVEQIRALARSVENRVDLIQLRVPGSKMPSGSSIPHFKRAAKVFPANVGMNILVMNNFTAVAISIFSRFYTVLAKNFMIATTLEEAVKQIQADRAAVQVPAK